jgi:hypothetical protein
MATASFPWIKTSAARLGAIIVLLSLVSFPAAAQNPRRRFRRHGQARQFFNRRSSTQTGSTGPMLRQNSSKPRGSSLTRNGLFSVRNGF